MPFTWDGSVFTSSSDYSGPGSVNNATISSPTYLLGIPWSTQDVQIFGPGGYSFGTTSGGGTPGVGTMTMTVGTGQLGVHLLLDWNGNLNIDIANVWNLNSTFGNCNFSAFSGDIAAASNCIYDGVPNPAGNNDSTVFLFASTGNNGDGTLGIPMADGDPFAGFNFNFNVQGTLTPVPLPAAAWLFGSGLPGLLGFARKNRAG